MKRIYQDPFTYMNELNSDCFAIACHGLRSVYVSFKRFTNTVVDENPSKGAGEVFGRQEGIIPSARIVSGFDALIPDLRSTAQPMRQLFKVVMNALMSQDTISCTPQND